MRSELASGLRREADLRPRRRSGEGDMPYAENRGLRIHYEVEGQGPTLVLQHGFTHSVRRWYLHGYVEALRTDYELVLIDARGHGLSDKPHDPTAYTLAA